MCLDILVTTTSYVISCFAVIVRMDKKTYVILTAQTKPVYLIENNNNNNNNNKTLSNSDTSFETDDKTSYRFMALLIPQQLFIVPSNVILTLVVTGYNI